MLPVHCPPLPQNAISQRRKKRKFNWGEHSPESRNGTPPHFEHWYSVTLFCQINAMAMCFLHLQQEQEVMGSSPCHSRWFTRSLHAVALYACMGDTARWCSTSHESYTVNFQGYFEICFLSAHRMILYLPEVSCEAVHVFLRGWLVL